MAPADSSQPERNSTPRAGWVAVGIALLVLASRWPFLEAGYGSSLDAWRVAWAGRHIAETGQYVVSRFPGYPLQEYSAAFLQRGGPLALNGLSAVACAAAAVLFYWYLRRARLPLPWLGALALAFAPAIYVASVSAKDYVTALAFLMGALLATQSRRPLWAGVCLGLAIGFRPASVVVGFPLAMLLAAGESNRRALLRRLALFALSAAAVALLAFVPVMRQYGWGFLRGYPHEEPWWNALYNGTKGFLGVLGCVGLVLACVAAARWRSRVGAGDRDKILAWTGGVLMVVALFLFIPYQTGYLIPAAAFVILLAARLAPSWATAVFLGLTILSSFLDLGHGGLEAGAIIADHRKRLEQIRSTEEFVAQSAKIPGRVVFVVGGRHALVAVLHPDLVGSGNHRFAYLLERGEAEKLSRDGFAFICSEEVRRANLIFHDVDLVDFGAHVYDAPAGPPPK